MDENFMSVQCKMLLEFIFRDHFYYEKNEIATKIFGRQQACQTGIMQSMFTGGRPTCQMLKALYLLCKFM